MVICITIAIFDSKELLYYTVHNMLLPVANAKQNHLDGITLNKNCLLSIQFDQ